MDGMERVRSINPVVGETNDGGLNDIRGRHVGQQQVDEALRTAVSGPVAEGSVGAGVGTQALGFKGGIGTSSRRIEVPGAGSYTVGVLVQSNFGGNLTVNGAPVGREVRRRLRTGGTEPAGETGTGEADQWGSCMIIVATDAPLEGRNLERLAFRALGGFARIGASFSNGSGDYVIAFSTSEQVRVDGRGDRLREGRRLGNDAMNGLFGGVMDATEEAILNSLLKATTVTGIGGATSRALPIDLFLEICREFNVIPPAR
jgi:D-aminopeptidase